MQHHQEENTRFQKFIKILNLLKKPVDVIDDSWNGMRNLLSPRIVEMVGPFLVGGVSVFIHILEGYNSIKEFWEAYRQEQIGQRKTRLLTSFLSFGMAGAGAGLSVALLIGGFAEMGLLAVEVSSMALLPFLIPTLLFGIYSLALWKNSYVLHRSKEIAEEAKNEYENYIQQPLYDFLEAERLFQNYQTAYGERLEAEKEVALHTLEVVGSALVSVGIFLGIAATIGASVASFGALPLGLLVGGVALGFASKIYEYLDGKKDPSYSERLRTYFRNKFNLPDDEPRQTHRNDRCLRSLNHSLLTRVPSEEKEKNDELNEQNIRYALWTHPPSEVGAKPLKPVSEWTHPPSEVGLKPGFSR